jgi:cardiolipin synthase C
MQTSFTVVRRAGLALVITLGLAGCASLPSRDGQQPSTGITGTAHTRLAQAIDPGAAANAGKSGIYALEHPHDAFAARVILARAAESSLDVQYYIWHGDTTGYLLFAELWDAAERGVRVRLLLDDNGIGGLDATVAALDSHANIEVRLFNPFVNRSSRMLGYVTDFSRLNRRMHNKSFTADGRATIVGGRNIGDEYFGAGDGIGFIDLDVIAAGPAAREVTAAFDMYWNSPAAYASASIVAAPAPDAPAIVQQKFAAVKASTEAAVYVAAVQASPLVSQLQTTSIPFEWVPVILVYDDPVKVQGTAQATDLMLTRLLQAFGDPEREVDIISPYFVPGTRGTEQLCKLPARGVRLRIVTNSLAATDVGAVHAAYGKHRKALLVCGASLHELKPDADTGSAYSGSEQKLLGGSSTASLHAKSFALDRNRVFVGSFNLDPRSTELNTEMGLVIASPQLAGALADALDRQTAQRTFEVVLDAAGHDLEWIERTETGEVRHSKEPDTTVIQRAGVKFLSWLPIDWMM